MFSFFIFLNLKPFYAYPVSRNLVSRFRLIAERIIIGRISVLFRLIVITSEFVYSPMRSQDHKLAFGLGDAFCPSGA
jgi:hypothetical protein